MTPRTISTLDRVLRWAASLVLGTRCLQGQETNQAPPVERLQRQLRQLQESSERMQRQQPQQIEVQQKQIDALRAQSPTPAPPPAPTPTPLPSESSPSPATPSVTRTETLRPGWSPASPLPNDTFWDYGLYSQVAWGFTRGRVAALRGDWVRGKRGAWAPCVGCSAGKRGLQRTVPACLS